MNNKVYNLEQNNSILFSYAWLKFLMKSCFFNSELANKYLTEIMMHLLE
jgi:hypothetical protein